MRRYARVSSVIFEPFAEATLLLDHESGRCVELNASAACVWESLVLTASVDEVAQMLVKRFSIDSARARADARSALEQLLERDLIAVIPPASAPASPALAERESSQ